MVGDDGKIVNNEEIKDTIQSARLEVLRSTKYKRCETRADYAISYHDSSTQYGLIENFISHPASNHLAVEVLKLIETQSLPYPSVPFIKKFRVRYALQRLLYN